jgi:RNA polymerase sigma-70 factor, ECF subfamily
VERRSIAAPEADATHSLFERHSRQIYNYCLHQLSSREEAEDAVQTTFMNAFRGLKRGIVPEAEQAWLFKIAENVCLSRRRSSWRRGRVETPNDFEVLQEIVPSRRTGADELIGLEDALEAMPVNQRRAILLREWQGLSYREIADELDISQAAVETLIFRARRALAQGLQEPPAPKRAHSVGRGLNGINVGTLFASLKSLLTGSAAVKAVAVAVAAGTATVAATEAPQIRHAIPAPGKRSPRHALEATLQTSPVTLAAVRPAARSASLDRAASRPAGDRARAGRLVKAIAPSSPKPGVSVPAAPPVAEAPTATAAAEPAAATPAAPQRDERKAEKEQAPTPSTGSESPSNGGAPGKGKDSDDSGKGEKKRDRVASQGQTPPPAPAAAAPALPTPPPGDVPVTSPPQTAPVPATPAAGADEHGKSDADHEQKDRERGK